MQKTFVFKSLDDITPEIIAHIKSLLGNKDEIQITIGFNEPISDQELISMKQRAVEQKLEVEWSET